jgi:hypothetical protein
MTDQSKLHAGARMLPAVCPVDVSPGERQVFRMLQQDPAASGWIVLHSLDLADHVRKVQGEADFVVLIPEEGVVVVEVKSHSAVRFDEGAWWLGNSSSPDPRGPFKQASGALHSVRKFLQQRGLASSVPFASAVVFSNASFSAASPEWHAWQVLDKQALNARPIAENLRAVIRKARQHYNAKGLRWMESGVDANAEVLAEIALTLRPRFEVLASPSARRTMLEEDLIRCTEQQFRVLDDTAANSRLLVTGLAGTGKTTLAVEVVRREKAENPESIVGFFCFNKLLGELLAAQCASLHEGFRPGSLHSWMIDFSGQRPPPGRSEDPEFWSRELPEYCIAKLTAPGMASGFLDLLVLDEAQDLFVDSYLDVFDLLLKGGLRRGRWRFFGDFERQDIFARGSVSRSDFLSKRVDERCAMQSLSENCRNTQEISAVLTTHARLKPGYSRVLRNDTRHDPEIIFYSDEEDQLQKCLSLLEAYQAEGFSPREVVLLSPQRSRNLPHALAQHPRWKGRVVEYRMERTTLSFSTIHAFKGLESPVVILTDVTGISTPHDRDLLYVGMSRALHRLAVLCHDDTKNEFKKSLIE